MARPVVLGNGSMFVGLNEHGLVHDFYYPYVGLENLTTSRASHHKIGVFIEEQFSWVDTDAWQRTVDFHDDALISRVVMENTELEIRLEFEDYIDSQYNAFTRRVQVHNLAESAREIRLFFHQVFQISQGGRADTALFEPEDHYILDYKGRCCLLTYGQFEDGQYFDQYAIGNCGIEGKEGTYKDAEDGALSCNPVEHGGVDSVIRLTRLFEPGESHMANYWVVAGDSQTTVERIHKSLLEDTLETRLTITRDYWKNWLQIADQKIAHMPEARRSLLRKSLLVIKAHSDHRGGVIASGDSSIYNYGRDYYSYVWPRDGAYVFWPLTLLGYTDEPKRFFEFCRDILSKDGYLMHKYQPDRAIGSTWHPLVHGNHTELAIQEDETAIVIVLLREFLLQNPAQEDFVHSLYNTLIARAANFMEQYFDTQTQLPHASYDLWEEKFLTSSYTVAVTYQALKAATELADRFDQADDASRWFRATEKIEQHLDLLFDEQSNVLRKGYLLARDGTIRNDDVLDISSLYGFVKYALPADEAIRATRQAIEERLLDSAPIGGVPRYEGDNYFKAEPQYQGNPWFVSALWLAQCYIHEGNSEAAEALIQWSEKYTLPSGIFAEQINPTDGTPVGVAPLVWSHAELIRTLLDYYKK